MGVQLLNGQRDRTQLRVTKEDPMNRVHKLGKSRKLATALVAGAVGLLVIVAAVAGGRHLLAATSHRATSSPPTGPMNVKGAMPPLQRRAGTGAASAHMGQLSASAPNGSSFNAEAPGNTTAQSLPNLPPPVLPSGALVVKSADVSLSVARNAISPTLGDIATMAHGMGGYVSSQSTSGSKGTSKPTGAHLAIRVAASNFESALSTLGKFGTVSNESVKSQDVTGQVADIGAKIQILQSEDTLLRNKLASTTSTTSFLAIENQLTSVDQDLQGLQAQQGVLTNFAQLATIDIALTIPGLPAARDTKPGPPNSALVAWRYARHNSLAVLDAFAVSIGWALPFLVLAALGWLGISRARRRQRARGERGPAPLLGS